VKRTRVKEVPRPAQSAKSSVDVDLHGLVGIRLLDSSPADRAAVSAQIGPLAGTLEREPDITIQFVDEVRTDGALRYVDPDEIGFTDGDFVVLTSGPGREPSARIPLDALGESIVLVCRSGGGPVPLLGPIIDMTMLGKGIAPVHASAFTYEGKGTMVAGWAGGAKTTSLLAFMSNGAEFIADDRVYLDPDQNRLYGLPQPISLRARHLAEFPRYRDLVTRKDRSRLQASSILGAVGGFLATRGRSSGAKKLAGRLSGFADDASVAIPPDRLFAGAAFCGTLETAFLSIPHESHEVRVEAVGPDWLADRLVFLLRADRQRFDARYLAFRYAFPERGSRLIESAADLEREIVVEALRKTDTYAFYHPSPTSAQALFPALMASLA
jgi:hypothetical protein